MKSESSRTLNTVLLLMATALILSLGAAACSDDRGASSAKSQYLPELNRQNYSEASPPSSPPVFRWDFSGKGASIYSYEQEVNVKTDMSSEKTQHTAGQDISAKATLLINSHGNGTADLVLKDMKMSVRIDAGGNEPPRTMEQTAQPIVVRGVKEDGSGMVGEISQDALLKLLFPLPTRHLEVGQYIDVPAQMPFNAMGSTLKVTGRQRITLKRYVTVGGRKCAQFDVDIDISDLDAPAELGEYKASTRGASVLYFDIDERRFVSGTSAVLMKVALDVRMPSAKAEENQPKDMPKRVKMTMSNDNLIRFKLAE